MGTQQRRAKGAKFLLGWLLMQFATVVEAGQRLNDAVKLGSVDRVVTLLEEGASISSRDSVGWTPLHNAADTGNVALTKLLLGHHARVEVKDDNYGKTPLHLAASNGREDVLQALLDAGATPNATDVNGQTPLHLASWNGHFRTVLLLIDNGANINAKDKYGSTPLRLAVIQKFSETVEALLSFCPDLRLPDNKGVTVEEFAKKKGLHDMLVIMQEHRRTPCSRHKLQNVARQVHLTHNADRCPRGEKHYPDFHVQYSWRMRETAAGEVATIPCPAGTSGSASWHCGLNGKWQHTPNLSNCHSLFFSGWQEVMATDNVTAAEVIITIASNLRDTDKGITLAPGDLITISGILEKLQNKHQQDFGRVKSGIEAWKLAMRFLEGVMDSVDTMLSQPALWWGLDRHVKYTTFTRLQNSVKFATTTLATHQMDSFQEFSVKSLTTRVMNRPISYYKSILLTFSHPQFNKSTLALPFNFYDTYDGDQDSVRVSFVAFANLHCAVNSIPCSPDEVLSHRDLPALGQVNSPILGATIGDGSAWYAPLGERVIVKFQHIYNGDEFHLGKRTCVWWDGSANTWVTDGCRLVDTNDQYSICHCDHLTNLAIITDINGVVDNRGAMHSVMIIVIIVGCVVSAVSLTLCIVCFLSFREVRRDDMSVVHANLCFSLLMAELVLISGLGTSPRDAACTAVAALLHYFFLATFLWIAIEALHVYIKFVKVPKTKGSPLKYYMTIGYLIPLVYVALTVALVHSQKRGPEPICWLSSKVLIWSFVGPIVIILLFNGLVFLMAICTSRSSDSSQSMEYKHSSASSSSSSSKSTKSRPKDPGFWQNLSSEKQNHNLCSKKSNGSTLSNTSRGRSANSSQGDNKASHPYHARIGESLSVLILLCLTWVAGFFYHFNGGHALALAFTFLNSMQGVAIFFVFIFMNSQIMRELRSVLK